MIQKIKTLIGKEGSFIMGFDSITIEIPITVPIGTEKEMTSDLQKEFVRLLKTLEPIQKIMSEKKSVTPTLEVETVAKAEKPKKETLAKTKIAMKEKAMVDIEEGFGMEEVEENPAEQKLKSNSALKHTKETRAALAPEEEDESF